ncbi:MAG: EcsC family protein [Rhodothermales bacterium]|nr:EcsC family protein [Rhodothermales bacterium]
MRLTSYEKDVQREIEDWQRGEGSFLMQAVNWAMQPVDWVVRQVVSPNLEEQADDVVTQFLSILNDASEWTHHPDDVLAEAKHKGLEVENINDLRDQPLDKLDELARGQFNQNAILAAVEGGGAGLGGLVLIAADIPLLFTINLRMIQQIAACYGFILSGPSYRPLVLSVFNVAATGSRESKSSAVREISVAAAAFANDLEYKGRVRGAFKDQNRHAPREIVKNLLGRKLAQAVPIAGAAVGAGINYWFTTEAAEASFMLFRALYLERKERR